MALRRPKGQHRGGGASPAPLRPLLPFAQCRDGSVLLCWPQHRKAPLPLNGAIIILSANCKLKRRGIELAINQQRAPSAAVPFSGCNVGGGEKGLLEGNGGGSTGGAAEHTVGQWGEVGAHVQAHMGTGMLHAQSAKGACVCVCVCSCMSGQPCRCVRLRARMYLEMCVHTRFCTRLKLHVQTCTRAQTCAGVSMQMWVHTQ